MALGCQDVHGNSDVAGGGNGMNVNQANLCLTKSVCTLGISSHFFSGGDFSCQHSCAVFAVTQERYQLALTEDLGHLEISIKTEPGT